MVVQQLERSVISATSIGAELDKSALFRSFFQLNANAICVIAPDATVVRLNPSAETMLGSTASKAGQCFVSCFAPDKHSELRSLLQSTISGSTQRVETALDCVDGKQRFFRLILIPALNDEQQVIGVFCVLIDLTRKNHLLKALAQSEQHYRQLVEFAPVAIIVHSEGQVLFANQAAQRLLMKPLSEADNLYEFIHPADRPLVMARRDQPIGTMLPFIELRLQRHDQQYIYVEAGSLQIIYQEQAATLSICRDITAERMAQEAVAASEAKYRLIADNMTDLVGLMDAHGLIRYASPSHFAVLGYQPEVLIGTTFADYLHPEDVEQVTQQFIQMVQYNEAIRMECRVRNGSGQWVWLETHGGVTDSFDSAAKLYLMVSRDVTERKMLEQKLSFMAFHDGLTQLPNRRLFVDRLTQAILEHQRSGLSLAVIYMDLDKFKLINDSMGHDVGDELLVAFAQRVRAVLRDMDTMARFGGDEFVILLPDLQSASEATLVAQRILSALQQPWELNSCTLTTTSSMGIALFPANGSTAAELVKQADMALYQAKDNGRNGYAMAAEVTEKVVRQLSL